LTVHFSPQQSKFPGIDSSVYRAYAANTDFLFTDLYPLAHSCNDPSLNQLSAVYDYQRQLAQLAGEAPTAQWIEVNQSDGQCGPDPVSPAQMRAEAWLAIAGGATGIGEFTHAWPNGIWERFSMSPEMTTGVTATNQEIQGYRNILLAPQLSAILSAPGDPIKIGARVYEGKIYLIAVNSTESAVDWQSNLTGLNGKSIAVVTDGRTFLAHRGQIVDTFEPLAMHIYSWNSKKGVVSLKPRPKPRPIVHGLNVNR
jgi:hypothetical protein